MYHLFTHLEVKLQDKHLIELYESGKSRKLKLPQPIVDKFFATIQKIEAAIDIYDLTNDRGLNFEKLKGTESKYSMRLNRQYRLEMEVLWENDPPTKGVFVLLTISNHYA